MTKIAVFDGTYLIFRAIFASLENPILSENYIKYLLLRMIIKSLREVNGAYPIIALDYGGSDYRKSIYPEYKGDRVKDEGDPIKIMLPDGKYKGLEISDKQVPVHEVIGIRSFFDGPEKDYVFDVMRLKLYLTVRHWVINELPKMGIQTAMHKGYEGDDWAALFSNYTNHNGVLISDDSDWRLYLNDKWSIYKPLKEQKVTIQDLSLELKPYIENTTISPTLMLQSMLALTGTHNNVIGYSGIGEVNGGKISRLLLSGEPLSETNKRQKSVMDNMDKYTLNMKVIGCEFLSEYKSALFDTLIEYQQKVGELTQVSYMAVVADLKSENLDNMFFDFSKHILKINKEELVENFR